MLIENDVLAMQTYRGLWQLRVEDYADRNMTLEEFNHIGGLCNALWLHSGDPQQPHAELTTGKCSNGFINTLKILKQSNLCEILALMLCRRLAAYGPYGNFHRQWAKQHGENSLWVVGSDHAGATLSHSLAIRLRAQHDFAEKGPGKTQLWQRFPIEPNEYVLQVEELVTTTATLQAVRNGLRAGTSQPVAFAPVALTLVHRSTEYEIEGSPILSFVHYDIETWDTPDVCPLCQAGSQRIRPKGKQEWALLTGQAA